jgi:hypothetical protein
VDALDLLFRRLVLTAQAADAIARPIDLGELMDTFVPYKAARRDGMIETNDDYLHVVMRLVAGEREFVFADDLMQDDLRNELATSNPDLGLLRTYLNATVRLSSTSVERVLGGDTKIDLRPSTPIASSVVLEEPVARISDPVAAPVPDPIADTPAVPAPSTPRATHAHDCPYCAQVLPTGRDAQYCPNCGINLKTRRCPGCSTEIESAWKFCVTCGRSAA